MQERLARTIVDALQLQLTADEHKQLAAHPIDNVHAYECYLQARQEAYRWRQDAIDHAIQLLRNGLAIIGENAELYAALGRAHLQYREAGSTWAKVRFARPTSVRARSSRSILVPRGAAAPCLDKLLDWPDSGGRPRFEGGP